MGHFEAVNFLFAHNTDGECILPPIKRFLTVFIGGLLLGAATGIGVAASLRGSDHFTDVPRGAYFDTAVGELSELGIIRGYDDRRFGPDDFVTRGQVAVLLQRLRNEILGIAEPVRERTPTPPRELSVDESADEEGEEDVPVQGVSRNPEGSVRFTLANYDIAENKGTAQISVIRAGGSEGEVNVSFRLDEGTAKPDLDYIRTGGKLHFAHGNTSQSFTVRVVNDPLVEGNEKLTLVLADPEGGLTLGIPSSATLTIEDDETQGTGTGSGTPVKKPQSPTFNFSALEYSMAEDRGTIVVTVQREHGTGSTATVQYATSDGTAKAASDYDAIAGTLTFGSTEKEKTFSVTLRDDASTEGNEKLTLQLSNPSAGTKLGSVGKAELTIVDDEVISFGSGAFRLSKAAYAVLESDGEVVVIVERVSGTEGQATINYLTSNGTAKAGTDYGDTSGVLVFKEGETKKQIVIPILEGDEPFDETFTFLIRSPTGAGLLSPESAEITIQ